MIDITSFRGQDHHRLQTHLQDIADLDASELVERKDHGPLNFVENKLLIEQAISLSRELLPLNLGILSEQKLNDLFQAATDLVSVLGNVRDFDVTLPNARARQRELKNEVRKHCDVFSSACISALPFLLLKEPHLQSVLHQTGEIIDNIQHDINSKAQDLEKRVGEKLGELDAALEVIRNTAAQAGVARHADAFKEAAAEHSQASKRWLVTAALLIAVTITVALSILYFYPTFGEVRDASIIQRIFSKLVVISLLYYSAIWSAKNYRAHRHLAVTNTHRQNALQTFESFVEGAKGDEATKHAVLLEATHCIFSPANTGYLGTDEDNSSNRIIEILKTVGSSSAGK